MRRRYPDEVPEAPSKRGGGLGLFATAFALMLGAMVALTADSHVDAQRVFVEVKETISKTLSTFNMGQQRYASLRTGEWPDTLAQSPSRDATPAIAIVIDDLGGNVTRTTQAIALPANVTLSFLPDSSRALELSRRAHQAGHEVIVHLPMQPSGKANPGEHALRVGLGSDELQRRTSWALSRVAEHDGVNNHMGSRFSESRADVMPVMREVRSRRLFFLDSRTSAKSQVETVAREFGVLTGRRDIFLDDDKSASAIARQLERVEEFARQNGTVIAIGHPYPETFKTLAKWSQNLKERGFRLAPVREVLLMREARTPTLVTAGISLAPARQEPQK
jgi:polysaccharide deacetylase 2 family uncharacterized protein YibQ